VVGQRCFVTLAATSEIVELHDAVLTDRRDIFELGAR
jgi:hypothetical protein